MGAVCGYAENNVWFWEKCEYWKKKIRKLDASKFKEKENFSIFYPIPCHKTRFMLLIKKQKTFYGNHSPEKNISFVRALARANVLKNSICEGVSPSKLNFFIFFRRGRQPECFTRALAQVGAIFRHFCVDENLVYSAYTWNGEGSKERRIEASAMARKKLGLKNICAVEFVLCASVFVRTRASNNSLVSPWQVVLSQRVKPANYYLPECAQIQTHKAQTQQRRCF